MSVVPAARVRERGDLLDPHSSPKKKSGRWNGHAEAIRGSGTLLPSRTLDADLRGLGVY
jgi:hypothetical protein